jgi:sugar phosphate isomerase/epimerase
MNEPFGRLAIHTWTLDATPLSIALNSALKAGFEAVELRRIDLKRFEEAGYTTADFIAAVHGIGIPVSAVGVEYGWIFAKGVHSEELFADFARMCEIAKILKCSTLMSAPGQLTGDAAQATVNIQRAGDIAAQHGLRLGIEFSSQHPFLNDLNVIRGILSRASRSNCGLVLDTYHLERSGGWDKLADVDGSEILLIQYSDVPPSPPTSDRPTDRLPPGKGIINWPRAFSIFRQKGYRGYFSYECPNPESWQRHPDHVTVEAVTATRGYLDDLK